MNEAPNPGACDLSIVIIHHRMVPDLLECLASIEGRRWDGAYEILVAHKDAGERLGERLAREFPRVRLIPHEKFGIARSRNLGIRAASGRYVVMLDADARLTDGALDAMVCFMDAHADCGAAGARLLDPDGTIQYSCRKFYTPSAVLLRRTPLGRVFPNARALRDHLMLDWDHGDDREIDWMQGACFLMRAAAIREVGLFDDRYVFGFEDVDWCFRAKKRGWKVRYMPEVRVIHKYQRSSARPLSAAQLRHLKSGLRFFVKHHTPAGRWLAQ